MANMGSNFKLSMIPEWKKTLYSLGFFLLVICTGGFALIFDEFFIHRDHRANWKQIKKILEDVNTFAFIRDYDEDSLDGSSLTMKLNDEHHLYAWIGKRGVSVMICDRNNNIICPLTSYDYFSKKRSFEITNLITERMALTK